MYYKLKIKTGTVYNRMYEHYSNDLSSYTKGATVNISSNTYSGG
jgi:hypothetical protein